MYWGLPGLILEIEIKTNIDDGSEMYQTYIATNVEALKTNKKITEPTNGVVVSREELNRINEENFEKMIKMREGGVDKSE